MPGNKLLIPRPSYEDTTAYLSKWSERIISAAKSRGKAVIDLDGSRANRWEFENCMQVHDPGFVVLNGHGNVDSVAGHNGEILLKSGENEKLVRSGIVYALSCKSAAKLGVDCVNAGARAYVGYAQDFIFAFDPSRSAMPLQDGFAKPFFESTNIIPTSLIKGNSVSDSLSKSKQMFQKNIEYFKTHTSVESSYIIAFLLWDVGVLKLCGDGSAVIG